MNRNLEKLIAGGKLEINFNGVDGTGAANNIVAISLRPQAKAALEKSQEINSTSPDKYLSHPGSIITLVAADAAKCLHNNLA